MKPLLCLALALCSCSTRVTHSNGTPWITSYSNAVKIVATSGSDTVEIDGLDNSSPTKTAMHGINRIAATAAGAAVAIAIPGSSAVPLVSKAAIAVTPHLTTPTTPAATPRPFVGNP